MIEDYPEISDDNSIAFTQLEAEFREEFEKFRETGEGPSFSDYMSKTVAAAKALGLEALSAYETPNEICSNQHSQFQRDVDSILVQTRIHYSRRAKELSVGFTKEQKRRIHHLIDTIRRTIEESSVSVAKKEKLFEIISKLTLEVDKPRTRFERFTDFARGLASVSREFAEEGMEPWWKWFQSMMGVIDDAKEAEQGQLPKPLEPKKIEGPRKLLSEPKVNDDEIPF